MRGLNKNKKHNSFLVDETINFKCDTFFSKKMTAKVQQQRFPGLSPHVTYKVEKIKPKQASNLMQQFPGNTSHIRITKYLSNF